MLCFVQMERSYPPALQGPFQYFWRTPWAVNHYTIRIWPPVWPVVRETGYTQCNGLRANINDLDRQLKCKCKARRQTPLRRRAKADSDNVAVARHPCHGKRRKHVSILVRIPSTRSAVFSTI